MAAPYHYIRSKLDRALVAYLLARNCGAAADVVPGKCGLSLTLPLTICWTERASPIPNTGSYTCRAAVIVNTVGPTDAGEDSATVKADSDRRAGLTFDAFRTIDDDSEWDSKKIAAQLTAAARAAAIANPAADGDLADFTALDVQFGDEEGSFEGAAWVEILNLTIIAAPSNVS